MERGYRADRGKLPLTSIQLRLDLPLEAKHVLDLYVEQLSAKVGTPLYTGDVVSMLLVFLMHGLEPQVVRRQCHFTMETLHAMVDAFDLEHYAPGEIHTRIHHATRSLAPLEPTDIGADRRPAVPVSKGRRKTAPRSKARDRGAAGGGAKAEGGDPEGSGPARA